MGKQFQSDRRHHRTGRHKTVETLNRVSDWCGGPGQALAWFRSQPLPSFGDLTAEDLLKAGRADALRAYLARVAEGGYA